MAGLKVFVSSTCIDLDAYRSQLRGLLMRLGYEPVMSDYSEVLFDPSLHTHASCIRDVLGADLVILLIGSRFGGTTVPQALSLIDLEQVIRASSNNVLLSDSNKISITQAEALQATVSDIPIFTFVDARVYADHHVYQANRDSPTLSSIKFPSIDKIESAKNIFEFINFLNHRSFNNSITTFQSFTEIESHLLKQWSLLFQRLLQERRDKATEIKKSSDILGRIEELKSAVLQALPKGVERNVARAVVKYRRLADFLVRLAHALGRQDFPRFDDDFNNLKRHMGVRDIIWDSNLESPYYLVAFLEDGGFVGCHEYDSNDLSKFGGEWNSFRLLEQNIKDAVFETAEEMSADEQQFERHTESLKEYHEKIAEEKEERITRPARRARTR